MMKRTIVWFGTAALGCLATAAVAQAPQAAADVEDGWRAVAQCARIGSAARRHACLDDVLRRTGLLNPEREAQARRESFGREAGRDVARTAPPAAPSAAPSAAARVPPEPANEDHLRTAVRSVRVAGNGRLVIVTVDGATWTQTESEEFHVLPRSGDVFEIRRGSFGSYLCSFGRSGTFRCRRLDAVPEPSG